jgi:peptide/nickel transport system substrate-binding protein
VLVRRAISLAANRRVMVDVISDGLGVVAGQHLPEWRPGYNPNIPPLEYDLEPAKRLLEQAGYHYETISIQGPQS